MLPILSWELMDWPLPYRNFNVSRSPFLAAMHIRDSPWRSVRLSVMFEKRAHSSYVRPRFLSLTALMIFCLFAWDAVVCAGFDLCASLIVPYNFVLVFFCFDFYNACCYSELLFWSFADFGPY